MQSQAFDCAIYIVYDLILSDMIRLSAHARGQVALTGNQTFHNARRIIAIATRL
jgi:hypothetical protein